MILLVLSFEKSFTIIISKSWKDWFITLKIALSIYFSVLYTGIHIDKKGNLFLTLIEILNLISFLQVLNFYNLNQKY